MRNFASPPEHLIGEPRRGPYIVVDQQTLSSAVLTDPTTKVLVDGGANVPRDELWASPRRAEVGFEPEGDSEVGPNIMQ